MLQTDFAKFVEAEAKHIILTSLISHKYYIRNLELLSKKLYHTSEITLSFAKKLAGKFLFGHYFEVLMEINQAKIKEKLSVYLEKRFGRNIPEFYRVYMNTPELLERFIAFRDSVMKGGKLSRELKEKIAYLVSILNECEACSVAHRKHLKEYGCPEKEIKALELLQFHELNERESVALKAVYEAVTSKKMSDKTMESLKRLYDKAEIIEIVSVISLYMFLNTFNNALGLKY